MKYASLVLALAMGGGGCAAVVEPDRNDDREETPNAGPTFHSYKTSTTVDHSYRAGEEVQPPLVFRDYRASSNFEPKFKAGEHVEQPSSEFCPPEYADDVVCDSTGQPVE